MHILHVTSLLESETQIVPKSGTELTIANHFSLKLFKNNAYNHLSVSLFNTSPVGGGLEVKTQHFPGYLTSEWGLGG